MNRRAEHDVLLTEIIGEVLVLSINSTATRNSVGPEFFLAATKCINAAGANRKVGAIVLTGVGRFFSSGGNLKQLDLIGQSTVKVRRARLELLHELIREIRTCPKPVIMAVEGGAAGAGMSLALAGDLLVSSNTAFFSAAYIKAGLSPDGGLTASLAQCLPRQLFTEMCLLGQRIEAKRLHQLGVVNVLTEPGDAQRAAVALGEQLAHGPRRATARILELCQSASANSFEQQLEAEAQAMVASLADTESTEGIAAVMERRLPEFRDLRR
ncbi:oxepin-CoA hydrolase, alternative type [Arthrobacter sp. MYb213]|uniref:oxepin-CoA hydrolase, alternative type n=1 Tax=Arthrobacter sp. MYb213 TaxID=1848595 RepID=UPI000CFD46B6|nr:enoyl-CoA hydratase family protein [Arthrobacter sp. MYb213]PRB70302.1 enoyl-CoA hydratase [Arthrobacter sp. MYb213]